jgi:RNA polymerase-binding transcription factor DksA
MDDADRAQVDEELRRQEALFRALQRPRTMQRRDADGTVICLACEAPIDPARLAAVPDAAHCLCCQRDYDRRNAL